MASALPPVAREQAFLETFFQCLSQLAYDKAKEFCDKEKDSQKLAHATTLWAQMVNTLTHLALAEKSYASLLFLGLKWFGQFGRRDSLRSSYTLLLNDLKKMEEPSGKSDQSAQEASLNKILRHLAQQLTHFVNARSSLMEFYEQMALMGSNNKNMLSEDLSIVISDVITTHQKNFHHPILSPLKTTFTMECDIVDHLIKAQLHMSYCHFLPSIINLNDAHSKLASLCAPVQSKDGKKLPFGLKSPPLPPLHQWLTKFKGLLVSKFSLYFYEVLNKQTSAPEMKALLSKTTIDFCAKITHFQKKSDAASVCIVFDSTQLQGFQKGLGYHHPKKCTDSPRGMDSYPAIFSHPEKPDRHWPSVVSIICNRLNAAEVPSYDKPIYFCDDRMPCTYFLMPIESRITLVVIFEAKKSERDSYINNFIIDMGVQIRCSKLFSSLRPGSKGFNTNAK